MKIDSKEGLLGLVDAEGFDSVDAEISTWIEMGEFDEAVRDRVQHVSRVSLDEAEALSEQTQRIHRILHPEGPWGWEFCSECN